jgi:hypothetical protein
MAAPHVRGFPSEMADLESRLIARRRGSADDDGSRIGVAISGGGIRSATFALGVFQSLAKRNLLSRIDYISTVSGGGYFGSFFGRLFTRDYVRDVRDVEWILGGEQPASASNDLVDAERNVLRWLRENGRYLAPQGSGDLLLAGAGLLRNWVAVQAVIATALLSLFLLLQLPRVLAPHAQPAVVSAIEARNTAFVRSLPFSQHVWWSPWTALPLLILAVAFAIGWSYWIVTERPRPARGLLWVAAITIEALLLYAGRSPVISLAAALGPGVWQIVIFSILFAVTIRYPADGAPAAVGLSLLVLRVPGVGIIERSIAWVLLVVASLSTIVGTATWASTIRRRPSGAEDPAQFQSQLARNILTRYLRGWLVAAGIVALIVTIDSIGQTMYAVAVAGHLKAWFAGMAAAFGFVSAYGRKLVVLFGGRTQGTRPPLSITVVATVVALVIVAVLAIGFDLMSHAAAWRFCAAAAPDTIVDPYDARSTLPSCPPAPERQRADVYWLWLGGASLLTFAFGRYFDFLNYSSHQALYSARLIRAYLGASNPSRWRRGSWVPVVEPIADDDIEVHRYWPTPAQPAAAEAYDRAAPLHLVNVTINETFSGESQVQQQDRKGIGMALGPAGVSAGVRHHVVYGPDAPPAPRPDQGTVLEMLQLDGPSRLHTRRVAAIYPKHTSGGPAFRMFEYPASHRGAAASAAPPDAAAELPDEFPGEPLSLGRWVAISGAAFSTGLGFRTSLGLSLLAGLANVRLGYWWDSGVPTRRRLLKMTISRTASDHVSRVLVGLFPVHTYLYYELTAHFPGSSRRHWYLSDGGHFENMGGYELIRRRLPLIIVLDAEADEDYTFEGLSNLTRKARLDFGVEIEFMDTVDDTLPQAFGPLESLRPVPTSELDPRRAASHAAVARVRYPDPDGFEGRLVYIKPGITGDEPIDLREYARHHPAFPQQTTADQFFDEAQWESYRKLGEHIGDKVFEHTGENWWLERWKYKPY